MGTTSLYYSLSLFFPQLTDVRSYVVYSPFILEKTAP